MAIPIACPACSQQLRVPDHLAGKKGRCPTCNTIISIPAPSAEPEEPADVHGDAERDLDVDLNVDLDVDAAPPGSAGGKAESPVGGAPSASGGSPRRPAGRGVPAARGRGGPGARRRRQTNPYATPAGSAGTSEGALAGSEAMEDFPPQAMRALRETRPWVLFLSILGFIATAFIGLGVLVLIPASFATGRLAGIGVLLALVYGTVGVLTFFVSYYMYLYAARIADFSRTRARKHLVASLRAQRSYWRLVGIITLIYLAFTLLAFLVSVPGVVRFGAAGCGSPAPPVTVMPG